MFGPDLSNKRERLATKRQLLDQVMTEMDWPSADLHLLSWYYNRLGVNEFLTVWQDQTFENEKRPPRSKYRAFRARLSKALGQTPHPSAERAPALRGAQPLPSADLNPHPPKGK